MSRYLFLRLKHGFAHINRVIISTIGVIIFFGPLPCMSMQLQVTLNEMTKKADVIFLGKVIDQECRYGPNQKMIFTDVYFGPEKIIYSTYESRALINQEIVLTFAGGEVGGDIIRVSDVPSFENGSMYLIFTRMDGKTYASPIIGGFQGLFRIITDEITGIAYPLTYGGRPIVEVSKNDIVTGPPIQRILGGQPIISENRSPVRFYAVAPQPPDGMNQGDAKASVSTVGVEKPAKIIPLNIFIAEIEKRVPID